VRDYERDEFLKEFYSSEKESRELEEVASIIRNAQSFTSSPSFQLRLREKLFSGENKAAVQNRPSPPLPSRWKKTSWSIPAFAAAAAVILILSLTIPQGTVDPDITAQNGENGPTVSQFDDLGDDESGSIPVDPTDERDLSPSADEGEEEVPVEPQDRDTAREDIDAADPEEPPAAPEQDREKTTPGPEEETVPGEPQFDVWNKQRSFRLAGPVKFTPLQYAGGGDDTAAASYVWEPSKIAIMDKETGEIGSTSWAQEVLRGEGFMFSKGDYLRTTVQETQKGTFVEIVYGAQGSAASPLYIYYQEGVGVVSYYYEERGAAAAQGFYALLSPSQAFIEQVNEVDVYAPVRRLTFSFQEVSFTYHDFTIEKNGEQQRVTLPAYSFLGMEVSPGAEEFRIHVPAVK